MLSLSPLHRTLFWGSVALATAAVLALACFESPRESPAAPLVAESRASSPGPERERIAQLHLDSAALPEKSTAVPARAPVDPKTLQAGEANAPSFRLQLVDGGSGEPLSFTLVGFRRPDLTWSRAFTDADGQVDAPLPPPSKGLAMRSYGIVLGERGQGSPPIGSIYEVTTRYLVPGETLTRPGPKGLFGQRLVPLALHSIPEGIQHLSFIAYDPANQQQTQAVSGSVERIPEPLSSVLREATHVLQVYPGSFSIADEPGVDMWVQANAGDAFPSRQIHAIGIANGKLYHAMAPARRLPRPGQKPLELTLGATTLSWIPKGEMRERFAELLRLEAHAKGAEAR